MKAVFDTIVVQVKKSIDDTDVKINALMFNATSAGTAKTTQFFNSFAVDISFFPCCRSYQEQALNLHDAYTDDLNACFAASDNSTKHAAFIASTAMADFGDDSNSLKNKTDTCIESLKCTSKSCLNVNMYPATINAICICNKEVENQAKEFIAARYSRGNKTLQTINDNCAFAIKSTEICINTALQNLDDKMTLITVNYNKCKGINFDSSCIEITTSKIENFYWNQFNVQKLFIY
jgi:hypothetical protein